MKSFLGKDKATITVMVQAKTPDRIKELMDKSAPEGAEAFGMQFEQLLQEYRNADGIFHLVQHMLEIRSYTVGQR